MTNEGVCIRVQHAIGQQDELPAITKNRKLKCYAFLRSSGIAKTILQVTAVRTRRREIHRKRCEENIKECVDIGESVGLL